MKTVNKITCPYCKSKSFRYYNGDKEMFLCHDCQRNQPWSFVSKINQRDSGAASQKVSVTYNNLLKYCQKVSELPDNHLCKLYVEYRRIPEKFHSYLYYTDQMTKLGQATEHELTDGQPKLIIPFYNEDGKLFGLQARSLDNATPKYLTLMFDKDEKKIFGKDLVNHNERMVCVEGPIDAMFLNNAMAMAGSDGLDNKYKTKTVVAFDNEPRSPQTVNKMKKYLGNGYNIVIWPDNLKQKDINDMVMSNINVEKIIHENTYSGVQGEIKLNSWKRVK